MSTKNALRLAAGVTAAALSAASAVMPNTAMAVSCFACVEGWDQYTGDVTHIDFFYFGMNNRHGIKHHEETIGSCEQHLPYVGQSGGGF
jgi:hypothetical protein